MAGCARDLEDISDICTLPEAKSERERERESGIAVHAANYLCAI